MCCFSGSVEDVSNTKIFVRFVKEQRQAIVYQMNYKAKDPIAMILPIPVADRAEDAVNFINLKEYDKFFDDLHKGFPIFRGRGGMGFGGVGSEKLDKKLKVVEVGNFVASFVPRVSDFSRLDEKFRLPEGTWDKLPGYKEFGFAVFQLKADATSVHPMAFTYPTKKDDPLFFPTVHIHDGEVHDKADFDHTLYLQPSEINQMLPRGWDESPQPAGMFMKVKKSQGLIDSELHVYRRKLNGKLKNADTYVA